MPNPTVLDLINRARGIVRETNTAIFFTNDDPQMIGWITSGLEEFHGRLRAEIPFGRVPDGDHPYWKQFWASKTIALVVDQLEYSLPSAENERFDLFHSLIDAATGLPLTPYAIEEEEVIKTGNKFGVNGGIGRFTFAPGDKVRVLVYPGSQGTPKEVRNLTLRYWRGLTHHTGTGETVDVRHEFTNGPLYLAIAKALAAKRNNPMPWYALAEAALKEIPPPVRRRQP